MGKILRKIAFVALGVIGVLAILVVALHFFGQYRLNNAPEVTVQMVPVPADEASIKRGQHIATAISSCAKCHKGDYSGEVFFDQPPIGRVVAPNLTRGRGGLGAYSDKDWVRAIRHGVGASGQTLMIMPSNHFNAMSDADLGALVAHLKTLPPVDHELPSRHITFPGTIILGVLAYSSWPATTIDHHQAHRATAPVADISVEHGNYLVDIAACRECHGPMLAGLSDERGPPPGPNLTPGGPLKNWTQADFFKVIRHGITPDNRVLDPEIMPWPGFAGMTDVELQSIWSYLQSVPAQPVTHNQL